MVVRAYGSPSVSSVIRPLRGDDMLRFSLAYTGTYHWLMRILCKGQGRPGGCGATVWKYAPATHFLDAGADLACVKDWLGHGTMQNTTIDARPCQSATHAGYPTSDNSMILKEL